VRPTPSSCSGLERKIVPNPPEDVSLWLYFSPLITCSSISHRFIPANF
jgi:hypothetical protein